MMPDLKTNAQGTMLIILTSSLLETIKRSEPNLPNDLLYERFKKSLDKIQTITSPRMREDLLKEAAKVIGI